MSWLARLRHPSAVRRISCGSVLTAVLLLCPLPASGGVFWDIGIGIGYVALVCAATLYLYPLRGAGLPHKRLFTLSQHRRIGWVALSLGILHAAVLLIAQPLVGHYLLPSAPLYMLLGLLALIALGVLVATGLSARTALRKSSAAREPRARPTTSVATHAILAALLLALLGAHIIGSGQLIGSVSTSGNAFTKTITLCLLLAIPLLWAASRVVANRRAGAPIRALPTLLPSCIAAAILVLLPVPVATPHLLQPAASPSLLSLSFPHEKHISVNCVTCHHNFVDKTGLGSCLDCHRSQRADLTQSSEATFHVFCRGCHTELAHTTDKHGPTRSCSACHVKDAPPQMAGGAPPGFTPRAP